MAAGDTYYRQIATGSTVTTSSGVNGLFGAYSGLSLLGASEVVIVQLLASGGDLRVSGNPAIGATNNLGMFIGIAASLIDLPPMIRTEASQMTFCPEIASEITNNPTAQWAIWRRV